MLEVLWVLSACYLLLFWIAYKIQDNSIVDVFWWAWFLIVSATLLLQNSIFWLAQILTFVLILTWSLRIIISIWSKKLQVKREDKRYAIWRKKWKYFYTRSFFQVYLLQMVLLILVATPLFIIFSSQTSNQAAVSIVWWIIAWVGLIYESIADYQLKKYLSNAPAKNTIFSEWLWQYSRHPNYLWESVFWLWISIISLQYSLWWIIWFLLITALLLFVSGVPPKEKRYKTKSNWKTYKKTPLFIPNFFIK